MKHPGLFIQEKAAHLIDTTSHKETAARIGIHLPLFMLILKCEYIYNYDEAKTLARGLYCDPEYLIKIAYNYMRQEHNK